MPPPAAALAFHDPEIGERLHHFHQVMPRDPERPADLIDRNQLPRVAGQIDHQAQTVVGKLRQMHGDHLTDSAARKKSGG